MADDLFGVSVEPAAVDESVTAEDPGQGAEAPAGEGASPGEQTAEETPPEQQPGEQPPAEETPPAEGGQQEQQTAEGQEKPPEKEEWLVKNRFRTSDDLLKNWYDQASYIGKLQAKIKSYEKKFQEHDIDLKSEEDKIADKVHKQLEEKMGPTMEYINSTRLKQVKDAVHETYPGFDFDANGDKILAELKFFDESIRNADPVGCLRRAVGNILASDEGIAQSVRQNIKKKQAAFTEGGGAPPKPQTPAPEGDELDMLVEFAKTNNQVFGQ